MPARTKRLLPPAFAALRSDISMMLRLAIAVALTCANGSVATAGLVGETSWKVASKDGRYLLVMVSPGPVTQFRQPYAQAEIDFRKRYKQSGLYRNDGAREPIWTMPYHLQYYEAYISPDGAHVLITNETWDHTISNMPAGGSMYFYHQDGNAASYRDHELTWCIELKRFAKLVLTRFSGVECVSATFDPQELTYTVKTNLSEECVFDVTSGKIIRRRSPWYLYFGVPVVLVPFMVWGVYRIPEANHCRKQFSAREGLLIVALIGILLGLMRHSLMLATVYGVSVSVGGGIAWVLSKSRRAWLTGAFLSAYGGFLGVLLWAALFDSFFSFYYTDPAGYVETAWMFLAIGFTVGAICGGRIERYRRLRLSTPGKTHKTQDTQTLNACERNPQGRRR